jgi:DNA-binding transcriptional LysR family regulator
MDTSLDDIALFVEVARRKNFSRAAESSGVPVSTLSRRISELERNIGVKLFRRSTRKVDLTEAGGVYFERCEKIVAEARIAHEQLLEVAQQPKGRLRVSMPTSLAVMYMPEIIREFGETYPDIDCEIDLSIHPVDLLADPFDLVIRFGHQPDSSVISRQIASASLGLYASADYLAKNGTPAIPADLVHHQCLRSSATKEDSTWVLKRGTDTERVTVSGRLVLNNVIMLQRMAMQGVGIVPMSCIYATCASKDKELVRVLPEWELTPIPLLALFPSRLMPAKTRVFLDFLQARLPAAKAQRAHVAKPIGRQMNTELVQAA